jgi:hypothetical protein
MNHKGPFTVAVFVVTAAVIAFSFFAETNITGLELVGAVAGVLYGAYCFLAFVQEWTMFAGTVPLDPEPDNQGWRVVSLVVGAMFYAVGIKFLYNI